MEAACSGAREALERGLERSRLEGRPCAVAVLDLDRFTSGLRAQGWEASAEPLVAALERTIRARVEAGGGSVSRYGRDAFLLVWPGEGPEAALARLEELRRHLASAPISVIGPAGRVEAALTFSAGVASFPRDADEPTELVCLAWDALAVAKSQGGGRTLLAPQRPMKLKTTYYLPCQLDVLSRLAERLKRTEASLLREALEDMIQKYDLLPR
ncbi:MAG: diguanylate cyclase [Acetobacteraceae bacterium]|nr:diguanylate cyclase [Acetobacteraceae bacterium]